MDESRLYWRHQLASSLLVMEVLLAFSQPGLLIGAAVAGTTYLWRGVPAWLRWVAATGMAIMALHVSADVAWAWPERLAGTAATALWPAPWSFHPTVSSLTRTVTSEALAGPLWLLGMVWVEKVRSGRLSNTVVREAKAKRAVQDSFVSLLKSSEGRSVITHPIGTIRLGTDGASRKPFDLALPESLSRHVTVLGKTGSGKTTTALRLMQGALAAGYPVVIVDAKGLGSLRRSAEVISQGLPFQVVAPGDPRTVRYNPCTGSAPQVSNKLVGAFAYGPEAEIYKNVIQETLPIVVRGLQVVGDSVTLENIADNLDQNHMRGLAARVGDRDDGIRQMLVSFSNRGNLYTSAFVGMRARLGALMHGEFGGILASDGPAPALDLAASFSRPGTTYLSLPAMASPEDVTLMARVLVQDVKQIAAARIESAVKQPALLVLDEFAALQDAQQLNDLLLQAREAGIACVVCTQFLPPEDGAPELRRALMGPGLFIAHQVNPEDAEPVAKLFGTEVRLDPTHQIDYQTGFVEKGSVRHVHEYLVHPDVLRNLPRGKAALRADNDTIRIASVDVALPAPANHDSALETQPPAPPPAPPQTASRSSGSTGGPIAFLKTFFDAIEGDGILLWAAALLIGWEGFFQWAIAGLYGAFLGAGFLEVQLGTHSFFGLTGGGAVLAVIAAAALGIAVGAVLGIVAFPFLALVWMVQNPQTSILWAGLGFTLALGITAWMYLVERSAGIRGYRPLTTAEQNLVLPIYHDVAEALGVADPPRLLIGDAPIPGAGSHLATITLTTALLFRPPQEIGAVLAHELGHHIHGHALRLRLAWACALPIVVLYSVGFALRATQQPNSQQGAQAPLGVDPVQFNLQLARTGANYARTAVALVPRVIGDLCYFTAWPAMHLMLLPIMSAASRRMELEADAVAASIGGAEYLASHLRSTEFADWTHGGWEAFSVKTHPPVPVRLDHLYGAPRRSRLDPVTRALDRAPFFGMTIRLLAFGSFVGAVLVAACLSILHMQVNA